jgi:hypothetical protein
MIVTIPGNWLTEQVGQETVHPAKVATSTEQKKIEDMPGRLEEGKADVAAEPNKDNRKMNRRNGETAKKTK